MIPLLVWPQEQRLGQMLTRVLAVLEEQDLYALPGDVRRRQSDNFFNWNATEDEEEDEDEEAAATARHAGAGEGSVTTASQQLRYMQEREQQQQQQQRSAGVVDGNGNEVPIIVIRPVARRPRQLRRILEVRRPRRKLGNGLPTDAGWFNGDPKKMGYDNTTALEAAENQPQTSRSRSRSPASTSAYSRHHRHGNTGAALPMHRGC